MGDLTSILIILLCLFIQSFFAGAEMGMISCNRIRIRHLAESGSRRARMVDALLESPQKLLGTTLVGVNVAVVVGASFASSLAHHYVGRELAALISTAVMWPLVLLFGEIVPMSLSRQYADRLVMMTVIPLKAAYGLLFPLVATATAIAGGIARLVQGRETDRNPFVTREELRLLIDRGEEQGALHREERRIIGRILEFGRTRVGDLRIPMDEAIAASSSSTVVEISELIAATGQARIPLYRDGPDDIIGTIHASMLPGLDPSMTVEAIMEPPFVVPENRLVEDTFRDLRVQGRHMGILVDSSGAVSGIVMLEDIVEEIVGEIEDE